MPITWAELEEAEPDQWTIRDALERSAERLWERFSESATGLEVAHTSLRGLLADQGVVLGRFDRFRS
jgi:DNA primase